MDNSDRGPQHSLTAAQLVALTDWAASNPLVDGLIHFGSRAKGVGTTNSDVDVAIALSLPDETVADTYFEWESVWVSQLQVAVGLKIGLALIAGAETPNNSAYVRNGGIALFSRYPGALARYGFE